MAVTLLREKPSRVACVKKRRGEAGNVAQSIKQLAEGSGGELDR